MTPKRHCLTNNNPNDVLTSLVSRCLFVSMSADSRSRKKKPRTWDEVENEKVSQNSAVECDHRCLHGSVTSKPMPNTSKCWLMRHLP